MNHKRQQFIGDFDAPFAYEQPFTRLKQVGRGSREHLRLVAEAHGQSEHEFHRSDDEWLDRITEILDAWKDSFEKRITKRIGQNQ